MSKPYSELAMAIDLIKNEYKVDNPIIISELIYNDLGICTSIHAISDYLEIKEQTNKKKYESIIIS
jgi:hypothetical protein